MPNQFVWSCVGVLLIAILITRKDHQHTPSIPSSSPSSAASPFAIPPSLLDPSSTHAEVSSSSPSSPIASDPSAPTNSSSAQGGANSSPRLVTWCAVIVCAAIAAYIKIMGLDGIIQYHIENAPLPQGIINVNPATLERMPVGPLPTTSLRQVENPLILGEDILVHCRTDSEVACLSIALPFKKRPGATLRASVYLASGSNAWDTQLRRSEALATGVAEWTLASIDGINRVDAGTMTTSRLDAQGWEEGVCECKLPLAFLLQHKGSAVHVVAIVHVQGDAAAQNKQGSLEAMVGAYALVQASGLSSSSSSSSSSSPSSSSSSPYMLQLVGLRACVNGRTHALKTLFESGRYDQGSGGAALCTICMTEETNVVLMPCRHKCVCSACSGMLQRMCPVCRAPCTSFMVVHQGHHTPEQVST